MTTFVVWECEYPDDGATEIRAATPKGARRAYRKMTRERSEGVAALIELGVRPKEAA